MNRILIAGAALLGVLLVPALAAGDPLFGRDDPSSALTSQLASQPASQPASDPASPGDDEVEVKGRITSLSPLTVSAGARTVACALQPGGSLAGFAVGDLVEITCDLRNGRWVVRVLKREDDEIRGIDESDRNRGQENDRDDGAVADRDDGDVDNRDDESVDDHDEGAVEDRDDDAVDDHDDGEVEDRDDGAANDEDDGEVEDSSGSGSADGDDDGDSSGPGGGGDGGDN